MNKNILLCGVGGQGTVLSSKLLSSAAVRHDIPVHSAETIGMAQRGGSVVSHLRLGEGVYSPLIGRGSADLILGFEPCETVRMLSFLKRGGRVVVSDRVVMPVGASLTGASIDGGEMLRFIRSKVDGAFIIDSDRAIGALGSIKSLNMVLLGAAITHGDLSLGLDWVMDAIRDNVKQQFVEKNIEALQYGAAL